MKTCFRCLKNLPLTDFYTHQRMADGHLGKCKQCAKADVAANYQLKRPVKSQYERLRNQSPERRAKKASYQHVTRSTNPEKYAARMMVGNAIRDGRLLRMPCEVCGSTHSEAHHDDYSKPLDVRWLCFKHHREHHGQVTTALIGARINAPAA